MRKLFFFLIVLVLASTAGVVIHNHPAYVYITMQNLQIQTSLWFAILAVAVIIFLVHLLIRFLRGIYRIPGKVHHFIEERKEHKLQALSQKTLLALYALTSLLLTQKKTLQDWQALYTLMPQLRKYTTLSCVALDSLEQQTLSELLLEAPSFAALEERWDQLSGKWQGNPQLLAIYVKNLIDQNQQAKAENILKKALKKDKAGVLLNQYARLTSKDSIKQLARAEAWLKQAPQNADLLFCLGVLCERYRLWGKAKTYLEMSLKLQPRSEVYLALGEVLEQLDQKQAALECYKAGLALS